MATKTKIGFLAAFAIAAVSVAGPATAELPSSPSPTPITTATIAVQPGIMLLPSVSLECSGSGASDVKHRGHSIKNTTGKIVPKGTKVNWRSSDKGSGSVTLAADLKPSETVDVIEPGQTNGYTCTASFYPGNADFAVKSIAWSSATTATIVVENQNEFADARESIVRVQSLKCLATGVASVDVKVPVIPKGGSVTVTATIAKANADYLQATANANGAVPETNKANNTQKSPDFGSNKSCTPQ